MSSIQVQMRRLSISTLVAFFCFTGASATADTFTEYLGYKVLENPKGEVVRAWSKSQWTALEKNLSAAGSDVGYGSNSDWYSAVEGASGTQYKSDATMVEKLRIEGLSGNPDDIEGMDELGVGEGTLPADMGAASLGDVALGAGAFFLGVEIGNGIDSIFGLQKLEPWKTEEEAHFAEVEYGVRIVYKEGGIHQSVLIEGSTEEHYISLPKGYYIECSSAGFSAAKRKELKVNEIKHTVEVTEYECPNTPASENEKETVLIENRLFHETGETDVPTVWLTYEWNEPKCKAEIWLVETLIPPCIVPKELPGPGELQPEIEKSNTEHELPQRPQEKKPVKRPHEILPIPPNFIEEPIRKHKHFREKVEKEIEPKESEEGIEIPFPEKGEEGKPYKEHLEELGFEDVTTKPVPEEFINPEVGPKDIVKIDPEPGKKYEPKTHVEVEVNPEDAPTPEPEGGGIGPPTEPGFDLPNFGILCEGFPFGVPCWLSKTIEGMAATASAPDWTIIPEMKILGHTIPPGKFDFVVLEPVMEIVRPVMITFSIIGLVLLFYVFAKGGGPPSGSGGGSSEFAASSSVAPDEDIYL